MILHMTSPERDQKPTTHLLFIHRDSDVMCVYNLVFVVTSKLPVVVGCWVFCQASDEQRRLRLLPLPVGDSSKPLLFIFRHFITYRQKS